MAQLRLLVQCLKKDGTVPATEGEEGGGAD
jgi:hypothetical protein